MVLFLSTLTFSKPFIMPDFILVYKLTKFYLLRIAIDPKSDTV